MSVIVEQLRQELKDPEYSEGYAESFLDSYIATQIKVLREQREFSQSSLADLISTRQGVISRIESVNYSKWNLSTLKKLARAFRVRLHVSFETYGSLLEEVDSFSRKSLERQPRESDVILNSLASPMPIRLVPSRRIGSRRHESRTTRRDFTASACIGDVDTTNPSDSIARSSYRMPPKSAEPDKPISAAAQFARHTTMAERGR